jgi:hypothetical protein
MRCSPEIPTSVDIHSGPSFELDGSGRLAKFTVYTPRAGRRIATANSQVSVVTWEIVPSKGYFAGEPVHGMRITYGTVPPGYVQTTPAPSLKPTPLPLGVISAFFAETASAPSVGGAVFMSPTGPVPVDVRDYCLRLLDGRELEVNCQTGEPYEQPQDIERFVQEHRILR